MDDPRTKEEIARYVALKGAALKRGWQRDLAAKLGIDKSGVTKIKDGTRDVSAEELIIIKEFFGHGATRTGELQHTEIIGGVPVVGRLGDNVWGRPMGRSESDVFELVPASDTDYPIEVQRAWTLEETTSDGEYRKGDRIYTVPHDLRAAPFGGEIFVVRTEAAGFQRFTLRKAVRREKGIVLETVFAGSQSAKASGESEQIEGLVIGFFRPQRKR